MDVPISTETIGHDRKTAVLIALCLIAFSGCEEKVAPPKAPPPAVTVTQPVQMTVPEIREYVGQIDSPQTIELRARVPGFLKSIDFAEGSLVTKGQLLFVIDPSQYEVALQQAQAQLDVAKAALLKAKEVQAVPVAEAALAQAEALKKNALQKQKDFESSFIANAVSRQQRDDAVTAAIQAAAAVSSADASLAQAKADFITHIAETQASVAVAEAAVAKAKLDLSYTRISSPIDGRIGKAEVKIGSLVGQSDPTLLGTISQTNPMYVYFSVSEREVFANRKLMDTNRFGQKDGTMPVQLYVGNDERFDYDGRINYVDRIIDPGTGTLIIRAEFPDPDNRLRPGNFGKIKAPITVRENAIIVSGRAVGTDQGGKFLLIVGENNVVEQRPVKLGQHFNGMVIVEEGLKMGEKYVINGLLRARPGTPVAPVDQPAPAVVVPEFLPGKPPAMKPVTPIAPNFVPLEKKE